MTSNEADQLIDKAISECTSRKLDELLNKALKIEKIRLYRYIAVCVTFIITVLLLR